MSDSKIVTMWDEEQNKIKKRERIEKYKKILGREILPNGIVDGGILKVKEINPKDLLIKGGYKAAWTGGWIRYFEEVYRYHAYIINDETIEIHTDKIKNKKSGKIVHIASTYKVKEEKKRLKNQIPNPPQISKKEKQFMKRGFKDVALSPQEIKKALEQLKNEKN